MKLSRRQLLSASVVVGAGGFLQVALACRAPDGLESREVLDLVARFQNPAAVRWVGVEAGEALGEGREELLAHLALERGRVEIHREIRDEHRRGETLLVRGWPLARTEARIYALVALAVPEEA